MIFCVLLALSGLLLVSSVATASPLSSGSSSLLGGSLLGLEEEPTQPEPQEETTSGESSELPESMESPGPWSSSLEEGSDESMSELSGSEEESSDSELDSLPGDTCGGSELPCVVVLDESLRDWMTGMALGMAFLVALASAHVVGSWRLGRR